MAFVNSAPILSRRHFTGSAVSPVSPTASLSRAPRTAKSSLRMVATNADFVPDKAKRKTMNIMVIGSASAAIIGVLGPFGNFFMPKSNNGGTGSVIAKDALGTKVKKQEYIDTHLAGSRELVQGLRGDATYLIVTDDKDHKDLEYYALNAICTHLGCVVPWNQAQNKFICPCHGSQYDPTGAVVRGPAPLPLALEHVDSDESGNVVLESWKEEDFRTGGDPWWHF